MWLLSSLNVALLMGVVIVSVVNPQVDGNRRTLTTRKNGIPHFSPQDAGDVHNRVVAQMEERMSGGEVPKNAKVYADMILEEILTLCEGYGSHCRMLVRRIHRRSKRDLVRADHADKSEYVAPVDSSSMSLVESVVESASPHRPIMSSDTKIALSDILDAVKRLSTDSLEDVVVEIQNVLDRNNINDNGNGKFSDKDRAVIESVAAVAVGSATYWTEAQANTGNAFHQMHLAIYNNTTNSNTNDNSIKHRRLNEENRNDGSLLDTVVEIGETVFGAVVDIAQFVFGPLATLADFVNNQVNETSDEIVSFFGASNNLLVDVTPYVLQDVVGAVFGGATQAVFQVGLFIVTSVLLPIVGLVLSVGSFPIAVASVMLGVVVGAVYRSLKAIETVSFFGPEALLNCLAQLLLSDDRCSPHDYFFASIVLDVLHGIAAGIGFLFDKLVSFPINVIGFFTDLWNKKL